MSNESLFQVPVSVEDPDVLKRFLDRLVERLDIVLGYRGDNPYAAASDLENAVSVLSQAAEELTVVVEEEAESLNSQLAILVAELAEQLQQLTSLTNRVEVLESEVSDILLELIDIDSRLDLLETNYTSLANSVAVLEDDVAVLDIRISDLEADVLMLTSYSTTALRDFNSASWQTAPIYTKFSALGSDIINAPVSSAVDDIDLDDTYGIVTDIVETSITLNPALTYTCYVEVRAAYVQKVIIVRPGFAISKSRAGSTWSELIANAWV